MPSFLPPRRVAVCAAVLTFASLLAGCSSDSDTSGGDSTAGLTGEPLKVGYINTEGKGALSFPTYTAGADLAVDRVNRDGGIGGRPLVLQKCATDGSPASSVSCSNGFIEDKVPLVISAADTGADATIPVLGAAKIPAFSITFQGEAAGTNPAFYQAGPPAAATLSIPMSILAEQDVKSFDLVGAEVPVVQQFFTNAIKPMAESLGLTARLTTYNPGSPDFTSVVSTLKANDSEGAIVIGGDEQCNGFATAATTLRYEGDVVMGACNAFIDRFGEQVAGYHSLSNVYPVKARDAAPAVAQADLDQYVDDVDAAGESDDIDLLSLYGYAAVMDVARVLETIKGDVSPASVTAAFSGLTDFQTFAGNTITCADRPASQGASCDTAALVLEVTDDGTLDVVGDGFTPAPGA